MKTITRQLMVYAALHELKAGNELMYWKVEDTALRILAHLTGTQTLKEYINAGAYRGAIPDRTLKIAEKFISKNWPAL